MLAQNRGQKYAKLLYLPLVYFPLSPSAILSGQDTCVLLPLTLYLFRHVRRHPRRLQ